MYRSQVNPIQDNSCLTIGHIDYESWWELYGMERKEKFLMFASIELVWMPRIEPCDDL